MTSQLNYLIAQQRHSELAARAEQARLVGEARVARSAQSPRRGRTCAAAADRLVVADGMPIALRQLSSADRAGLADLFGRLSAESRRRRFFSPKLELTPAELTFFTDIDHLNHEAVAAVDQRDNSIVGVARYVRNTDGTGAAEVAFEVADAFQRIGIGTALTGLTIYRAHTNGLRFLTATTLWENRAARRLLQNHGFRARGSHDGQIEHELKLEEASPCDGVYVR
ncbi:MAG TPA: GNAT family N-acetyltransferase [Solirubrobacteraceae bacterium]|nr:GNAT family N-acetyltransferase [Solirubrobacteraceae bacterium]